MHINPVIYYQSKMQLRSGKTTATKQIKISLEVQDIGDVHYKSYLSIVETLQENFKKLRTQEYTLERIKIISTIFRLVQSKMIEMRYLMELDRYSIKKYYLAIKDKIPHLIRDISEIVINRVDLDDSEIEEISSCLNLLMKLSKQFK
jgi:hypothetical protein